MVLEKVTSVVSAVLGGALVLCVAGVSAEEPNPLDPATTSTDWRDDVANLEIVRELNRAYSRLPFSREFEGVLDRCPVEIEWSVGPNLPVAWKGGAAGLVAGEIILAGGLWMPERANITYSYSIENRRYDPLPPPPFRPQYTQGACDGRSLYVISGRAAGRRCLKLSRAADGAWQWSDVQPLPEAEGAGRWLASVAIDPGKWLFLVSGHPTGTSFEKRTGGQIPDYRLRLDKRDATWERMAPYPGGARALVQVVVIRGNLYVFGGSHADPVMRAITVELSSKFGIRVPYGGVPNYRDAYRYDPDADTWKPLRSLPFPVIAGHPVALKDRYILLMGSADVSTTRIGKSTDNTGIKVKRGTSSSIWCGYGDRILCYHVEEDKYSHVGVMPYGVATSPWIFDGERLYSFGGEPSHGHNMNTETVLQIGRLRWKSAREDGKAER